VVWPLTRTRPGAQVAATMPKPVLKKSVADAVFDQLKDAILGGALPPGEPLPAERALSTQLGVGRSAVREALARLEQTGLVITRHGDTTRVQDFRVHAGLDLLPSILVDAAGKPNPSVLRACLEMRAAITPDVCRLCAQRSPHVGAELRAVVEPMRKEQDPMVLRGFNVRFWQAVVLGCQNVAYQLAYNSLRRVFDLFEAQLAGALAQELQNHQGFQAIAQAITSRDGERALEAARAHIATGLTSSLHAVSGLTRTTESRSRPDK